MSRCFRLVFFGLVCSLSLVFSVAADVCADDAKVAEKFAGWWKEQRDNTTIYNNVAVYSKKIVHVVVFPGESTPSLGETYYSDFQAQGDTLHMRRTDGAMMQLTMKSPSTATLILPDGALNYELEPDFEYSGLPRAARYSRLLLSGQDLLDASGKMVFRFDHMRRSVTLHDESLSKHVGQASFPIVSYGERKKHIFITSIVNGVYFGFSITPDCKFEMIRHADGQVTTLTSLQLRMAEK